MFEIIIILALLAAIVSGIWDLLTTEVPDQIPYAMAVSGLLYWGYNWLSSGNAQPFIISISIGTILLLLGLAMYKKGQWGAADAWVLSGIAYMIPVYNGSLFIIPYLLNFVFVSLAYVILYSLFIGFKNSNIVIKVLSKDLEKYSKIIVIVPALVLLLIALGSLYQPTLLKLWFLAPMLLVFLIFWRYAKVIENTIFKKKVNIRNLRTGDVLEKAIWVGLTAKEIKDMKKSDKKYVIVKDGVRFVPVFAITLIITLLELNIALMFF